MSLGDYDGFNDGSDLDLETRQWRKDNCSCHMLLPALRAKLVKCSVCKMTPKAAYVARSVWSNNKLLLPVEPTKPVQVQVCDELS